MKRLLLLTTVCLPTSLTFAVDFKTQVAPVLKQYCYKCHSEAEKKEKGKLALDNLTKFAAKIADSKMIKPGDAAGSTFYTCLMLPSGDDDHMPPAKEEQMKPAEIELIKTWITEGGSFTGGGKAPVAAAPAAPAMDGAMAPADAGAAAPVQAWTNTTGQTIQASFLRLEGENVVIQRADGVCFTVPMSKLSPESQELAKKGGK